MAIPCQVHDCKSYSTKEIRQSLYHILCIKCNVLEPQQKKLKNRREAWITALKKSDDILKMDKLDTYRTFKTFYQK